MSTEAEILNPSKTIAVVGLSAKSDRPSYRVASYLKENGYKIIPVNPGAKEILGETCYPDLSSIPVPVDVAYIFRRSEGVLSIVEEAIKIGARAVWMQEGVINEEAAAQAMEAETLIAPLDEDKIHIKFKEPQMAITPGQAAVLYDDDTVIGGGTIERRVETSDSRKIAGE